MAGRNILSLPGLAGQRRVVCDYWLGGRVIAIWMMEDARSPMT